MRAQRVLQIDPGLLRGLCCFTVGDRTGEAVRRAGVSEAAGAVRAVGVDRAEDDLPAARDRQRRRRAVFLVASADAALRADRHHVLAGGQEHDGRAERLCHALCAKGHGRVDQSRLLRLRLLIFREHDAAKAKLRRLFPHGGIDRRVLEDKAEEPRAETFILCYAHVLRLRRAAQQPVLDGSGGLVPCVPLLQDRDAVRVGRTGRERGEESVVLQHLKIRRARHGRILL